MSSHGTKTLIYRIFEKARNLLGGLHVKIAGFLGKSQNASAIVIDRLSKKENSFLRSPYQR